MIKIYGNQKTRAFRGIWACEEAGVDYTIVPVDFSHNDHQSPWYLAINPYGKVPAMEDTQRSLILFESAAIINYIARLKPEKCLIPQEGTRERSLYEQWQFFIMTELEASLWTLSKHKFALPKELRTESVFKACEYEFQKQIAIVNKELSQKNYLVNEQFTMVDLLLCQVLLWAQLTPCAPYVEELRPYIDRMKARAAFVRARAR